MKNPAPKIGGGGNLQSRVFGYLRWPLIVAVVFIHSGTEAIVSGVRIGADPTAYNAVNLTSFTLSYLVGGLAVPLFFFISGYLFFFNVEKWTRQVYFSKLRKRAKSLLIPYLFWNAIVLGAFYVFQQLAPQLWSGNNTLIRDYTVADLLLSFWNGQNGSPVNFPFWFIRDLMVLVVLSPLVRMIVCYGKTMALGVLGVAGFFVSEAAGFSLPALFFFAAGAYGGLYKRDLAHLCARWGYGWLILYAALAVVSVTLMNHPYVGYARFAAVLAGIPAVFAFTGKGLSTGKLRLHPFLTSASFFVFAAHGPLIGFLHKGLFYALRPASQGALLACYFGQVIVVIGFLLGAYYLLRRSLPGFTAWITGGR